MSYGVVELDKAFSKGYLRRIDIAINVPVAPPAGKRWLILNGYIYHVNGTNSVIQFNSTSLKDFQAYSYFCRSQIDTAATTGNYPIFNTYASLDQAQFQLIFITDDMSAAFYGAVGSHATIQVLEW